MTQGKLMIEKMIFSDDSRSSMVKKIHGYHWLLVFTPVKRSWAFVLYWNM